jgi:hypothetical protein
MGFSNVPPDVEAWLQAQQADPLASHYLGIWGRFHESVSAVFTHNSYLGQI